MVVGGRGKIRNVPLSYNQIPGQGVEVIKTIAHCNFFENTVWVELPINQ